MKLEQPAMKPQETSFDPVELADTLMTRADPIALRAVLTILHLKHKRGFTDISRLAQPTLPTPSFIYPATDPRCQAPGSCRNPLQPRGDTATVRSDSLRRAIKLLNAEDCVREIELPAGYQYEITDRGTTLLQELANRPGTERDVYREAVEAMTKKKPSSRKPRPHLLFANHPFSRGKLGILERLEAVAAHDAGSALKMAMIELPLQATAIRPADFGLPASDQPTSNPFQLRPSEILSALEWLVEQEYIVEHADASQNLSYSITASGRQHLRTLENQLHLNKARYASQPAPSNARA